MPNSGLMSLQIPICSVSTRRRAKRSVRRVYSNHDVRSHICAAQSLPDGTSKAKKRKIKRDDSTGNATNLNRATTPFDSLILPIVKIEQKHRKAVSAIIQESLAGYYGLPRSSDGE
jgi:hypothetical protein